VVAGGLGNGALLPCGPDLGGFPFGIMLRQPAGACPPLMPSQLMPPHLGAGAFADRGLSSSTTNPSSSAPRLGGGGGGGSEPCWCPASASLISKLPHSQAPGSGGISVAGGTGMDHFAVGGACLPPEEAAFCELSPSQSSTISAAGCIRRWGRGNFLRIADASTGMTSLSSAPSPVESGEDLMDHNFGYFSIHGSRAPPTWANQPLRGV